MKKLIHLYESIEVERTLCGRPLNQRITSFGLEKALAMKESGELAEELEAMGREVCLNCEVAFAEMKYADPE